MSFLNLEVVPWEAGLFMNEIVDAVVSVTCFWMDVPASLAAQVFLLTLGLVPSTFTNQHLYLLILFFLFTGKLWHSIFFLFPTV